MIIEDDTPSLDIAPGQKGVTTVPTANISSGLKSIVDAELAKIPPGHGTMVGRVVSTQGEHTEAQLVIAHRVSEHAWVATWVGKDFSKPSASWGVEGKVSW